MRNGPAPPRPARPSSWPPARDTSTTFGGLIALQNLLNESSTPPAIVSISYGECEAYNGAAANAAYNSAYQQAVAEGVSVFVSSGDEGAASCDADLSKATHGIGVSGFASTPYNVAVGGTDFGDTYAGTNSTYWNSTNTSTYGSAQVLYSGDSVERLLRQRADRLPSKATVDDLRLERLLQQHAPARTTS